MRTHEERVTLLKKGGFLPTGSGGIWEYAGFHHHSPALTYVNLGKGFGLRSAKDTGPALVHWAVTETDFIEILYQQGYPTIPQRVAILQALEADAREKSLKAYEAREMQLGFEKKEEAKTLLAEIDRLLGKAKGKKK